MAGCGLDYLGAATAFKAVDWGFVGQHWWEDNGRKCVTCVGSRDQVCLERICLSTKSPSQMLSAVLLNNTKWFFRLPLKNIMSTLYHHHYTVFFMGSKQNTFLNDQRANVNLFLDKINWYIFWLSSKLINIEINYHPDLEYVSKTHPAAAGRTCR